MTEIRILERVILDEKKTVPYLKVNMSNLEGIDGFFIPGDAYNLQGVLKTLGHEGFTPYLSGSAIANMALHGKRDYADIDVLAVHSNPDYLKHSKFIKRLRENSEWFKEDIELMKKIKKTSNLKLPIPKIKKPIKIGDTYFSVKDEHEIGYLETFVDARFTLRPRRDILFSDIDLSFSNHF